MKKILLIVGAACLFGQEVVKADAVLNSMIGVAAGVVCLAVRESLECDARIECRSACPFGLFNKTDYELSKEIYDKKANGEELLTSRDHMQAGLFTVGFGLASVGVSLAAQTLAQSLRS